MPDWNALRERARALHRRLAASLPDAARFLPPADALLDAAEEESGVSRFGLAAADPLLAGAHAVLDRDTPAIWFATGTATTASRQRFAQAHEYAHFWLHPDQPTDLFLEDDSPELFAPPGEFSVVQTATGYSRSERRETEANLFAAELLLPAPILRRAYLERGWSATQIARRTGLSETLVLSQIAASLLHSPSQEAEDMALETLSLTAPTLPLDLSQLRAAHVEHGPVLVDAGPGTGKTRTLIARAVHLLQERSVAPEQILALTFSNKAAEEMRTRLREAVGDTADRVWIGTFHAFGLELLRKDGNRIGLPASPTLLETADAMALLLQHLDRLELNEYLYPNQPHLPFADLLGSISRAKDELKTPTDYGVAALRLQADAKDEAGAKEAAKAVEAARVYAVYQELLAETGQLDFGDLIMRAVELLDRCLDVRARWQAQFRHILADEYQDVNRACAQLLRRLAGDGSGLWAVGDLRQAIYRFRGASPANVREFAADFPGGQRLSLERNYRSRAPIVRLFGAFAGEMKEGETSFRAWETHRGETDVLALTLAVADDEAAQAAGIAAAIRQWQATGIALAEQAILCHTNRQGADIAARLEAHGIATQHRGGLLQSEAAKDLLALLSLCCEPGGAALQRVAQFPLYAIPDEAVRALWQFARDTQTSFPRALFAALRDAPLSDEGKVGLSRLCHDIRPLQRTNNAWRFFARYLFRTSDFLRPLLTADSLNAQQELLAIESLLAVAQKTEPRFVDEPDPRAAFLDHLRLLRAFGQERTLRVVAEGTALEGVRVMTVHQAKGLEFPVVYLPNLVKDQFPPRSQGRMAVPPPGLLEEVEEGEDDSAEECLAFVALSRAREHLVLSRPARWNGKAIAPCGLLKTLEPLLGSAGIAPTVWPAVPEPVFGDSSPRELNTGPETATDASLNATLPEVSLAALEQYMRCPRQYYYRRVAHLPDRGSESTYLAFHDCLAQTAQWLTGQRARGEDVSLNDAVTAFEARWQQAGAILDNAQGRVLRQHADSLLQTLTTDLSASPSAAPPQKRELVAALEHGRVRLVADEAETQPDGTLHLVDYTTGRKHASDHTKPHLALLRHAARQQEESRPVKLFIGYRRDGERREVPEQPRYEPDRVEKFNVALRGIRQGHFEPTNETRLCADCPYFLICPA